MSGLIHVSSNEILDETGAKGPVTGGTYLQRTGLILAAFVGALSSIVIILLIGKWVVSAPSAPIIPAGADANTVRILLENYKSAQQIALEPYTTFWTQSW